jgi:hypothetical protein
MKHPRVQMCVQNSNPHKKKSSPKEEISSRIAIPSCLTLYSCY